MNKIGWLKITICAAFLTLFGWTFFLSVNKISAFKTSSAESENPQSCAACHQENFASWHRTAHRKTVRKAAAETVRGDFWRENRLEYAGVKAEMIGDGENFFIKIADQSYKLEAVVGANRIEQYVGEKDGEFYSLPVAYNLTEKRWIHLNEANFVNDADFEEKDRDFSGHLNVWKADCAACHQPSEKNVSNNFDDFGIGCAACHGNAAEHVASKNSWRARFGLATENKIVNPQNLSSDASMMICAECHARDTRAAPKFEEIAVEKSADVPVSAHEETDSDADKYRADGSHRFGGNEFQAIVRSVCYAQSKAGGHGIAGEKINCASCHSSHERSDEFAAEKTPNQNCINCHAQFSDAAAVVEHTKHPFNSEASNCASCHQPETVYGRMRFARTHEISVPNPVLTVEKQIPNACNLCHTDQSVNWAIASGKKLWSERFRAVEISVDKRYDQPETFRALRSNDAFLRALAADSLRKHSDPKWSAPFLTEALRIEKSPLVKHFIDAALQSNQSNFTKFP